MFPSISYVTVKTDLQKSLKNKLNFISSFNALIHTGKCIRRFAGIYAYCRYFIDRKWSILVLIIYRKTCHMPKGLQN